MGQWSNIYNLRHLNASSMHSTDSRLTSITRPFHISFHFSQAQIISNFCTILSGHLGCIRCILFRTTETHLASRGPRNNLTFTICQRHNDVVKGAVHMQLPHCINFHISFLSCD